MGIKHWYKTSRRKNNEYKNIGIKQKHKTVLIKKQPKQGFYV